MEQKINRVKIVGISLVILSISMFALYFLENGRSYTVKYVTTENGPKFKELEGDLYDVEEYKEGHYYLADDEGIITETTEKDWKKNRMLGIISVIVRLISIASVLVFSFLGYFYPLLKTLVTKQNYLFPR